MTSQIADVCDVIVASLNGGIPRRRRWLKGGGICSVTEGMENLRAQNPTVSSPASIRIKNMPRDASTIELPKIVRRCFSADCLTHAVSAEELPDEPSTEVSVIAASLSCEASASLRFENEIRSKKVGGRRALTSKDVFPQH
ncbi:hypothetical protein HPB51_011684 [Rhipicephalus microplus]|uniref:Uncharacterized protein n=1 Tax=Rhipicephalus microplus TaxID=6941 RepID=A0A9J6DMK3_RHIMP|nr:hypothetical protein HPB51_011684 [Rhipicephalus microplus]